MSSGCDYKMEEDSKGIWNEIVQIFEPYKKTGMAGEDAGFVICVLDVFFACGQLLGSGGFWT